MNLEANNKTNYIFKICRVHNEEDLRVVVKNGANMIGIHAVYFNRKDYFISEAKYQPIYIKEIKNKKLPLATLEIDSIREMQKYIQDDIKQVLLFQRPIGIKQMKECIDIYNLPINNLYIQLHYRTDIKEIEKIKKNICQNIIATIGIFQEDFFEYFWNLQKILNYGSDYILLDLSEHQSNLSIYNNSINKLSMIKKVAKFMEENKVPIILAEDTTIEIMSEYIKEINKYNILISGLDMQNSTELKKSEQRYEILKDGKNKYQIKKRKSENLIANWKTFFKTNRIEFFKSVR